MTERVDGFEGWAVLELLGHRRLAGFLSEQQIGGASFLRIDVPCTPPATQFYAPSAVYAITPCDEDTARRVASMSRPAPVQRWELPAAPAPEVEDEPGPVLDPDWPVLDPDCRDGKHSSCIGDPCDCECHSGEEVPF